MSLLLKQLAYRSIGPNNYFLLQSLHRLRRGYDESYKHFVEALPHGGCLLDIGANIGVTVAFAKRLRPDLNLVAFEPLPFNVAAAQRLCRVLRVRDVRFHQVALGDTVGTVQMFMPTVARIQASAQSYVVHDGFEYPEVVRQEGREYTVSLITIDSLDLPRVHGIKLDVENFEAYVLRGARGLIERDRPPIYCELWDTDNRREVIQFLSGLGYRYEATEAKDDFVFRWQAAA
jgi:FkbM family methyltransferase